MTAIKHCAGVASALSAARRDQEGVGGDPWAAKLKAAEERARARRGS